MIRSFMIKVVMLIATVGGVLMLGWPWAGPQGHRQLASLGEIEPTMIKPASGVSQSGHGNYPRSRPVTISTSADDEPADRMPIESRLDINQSTVGELELLPGIGPVLARRIVDRRAVVGGFQSPEDLREVKGLGAKRIDQLKSRIRFTRVPQP